MILMIDSLIKLADNLDETGHPEAADHVDRILTVLAQEWSVEDMSLDGDLRSIRSTLTKQLEEAIVNIRAIADAKPEDYRGSKSMWLWSNLEKNPIQITYPTPQ
jgi:hypothetical protein